MPTKIEKDSVTGTETTGHEWDGVKELNTPLPTWWVYTFYATVIWAIGYYVVYPSWPGIASYTKGIWNYSQRVEVEKDIATARAAQRDMRGRIAQTSLDNIRTTPDLLAFAQAGGRAAFADNCAPCHGPGGAGRPGGFPNLADDDWLWGGALADIEKTIRFGARSGHPDARFSEMPRFGDGGLTPTQIDDVAEFVLTLSGKGQAGTPAAERGKAVFADNCVTCHGAGGEGNIELGAPRLNDQIWLFGGDKARIMTSVSAPRNGVMPAWGHRLDGETIKMLAIYVHSLGGGK